MENVLHKDMAYGAEIMPMLLARELATQFLAEFSRASTRFFTNGEWGKPPVEQNVKPSWFSVIFAILAARHAPRAWAGSSWSPATSATFDTGVIVVSDQKIGCVWFQDED